MQEIIDWFTPRVSELFDGPPTITVDKEEITVVGALPGRAAEGSAPGDTAPGDTAGGDTAGEDAAAYRERTRAARVAVAQEAEELFRRKVSWGVVEGDETLLFTHLAVPVMTRLRQSERRVLDTLVAGGVARSRSDALAWCVRLVGRHEGDWIARLREALRSVEEARATGPSSD